MLVRLNSADVANAQLGINLPLVLGYARGRGNEVLNHQRGNKNRVVIRIASEGECDGIDALFINSKRVNHLDTTLVHFHPGVDGELGHGLTPDSNGGATVLASVSKPPAAVPNTAPTVSAAEINVPSSLSSS